MIDDKRKRERKRLSFNVLYIISAILRSVRNSQFVLKRQKIGLRIEGDVLIQRYTRVERTEKNPIEYIKI